MEMNRTIVQNGAVGDEKVEVPQDSEKKEEKKEKKKEEPPKTVGVASMV